MRRRMSIELAVTFVLFVWLNVLNVRDVFRHDPVAWAFFSVLAFYLVFMGARAMGMLRVATEMERRHKFELQMPVSFHFLSEDNDGVATVAVTRANGEMVTVQTPAGYDPANDGGQLLVQLACPDLFEDDEFGLEFGQPMIMDIDDDHER